MRRRRFCPYHHHTHPPHTHTPSPSAPLEKNAAAASPGFLESFGYSTLHAFVHRTAALPALAEYLTSLRRVPMTKNDRGTHRRLRTTLLAGLRFHAGGAAPQRPGLRIATCTSSRSRRRCMRRRMRSPRRWMRRADGGGSEAAPSSSECQLAYGAGSRQCGAPERGKGRGVV